MYVCFAIDELTATAAMLLKHGTSTPAKKLEFDLYLPKLNWA